MFKLSIETDGAAFEAHADLEIARILREIADKLEGSWNGENYQRPVWDVNGNKCGMWSLKLSNRA